jgi:hypothetical protein
MTNLPTFRAAVREEIRSSVVIVQSDGAETLRRVLDVLEGFNGDGTRHRPTFRKVTAATTAKSKAERTAALLASLNL